jgi:predicted nucleic acid-binding protein
MTVLVDTSVWSMALRRRTRVDHPAVERLRALIRDGRVAMIGPIRQELLSGIADVEACERLRDHLRAFPDLPVDTADYEQAAEHYTACRRRGIQGSNTDFLICAIAIRRDLAILTTDADFVRFAELLPIELDPRS